MHKHLDQVHNLNYKKKIVIFFELGKLYMIKITPIEVGIKNLTVFLLIDI